jgi:NAD(P)-dependent dehydrogenase (short-subunit alcohol dehydrogenase family)
MAVDISRYGITANAVIPGWMRTPMTEDYIAQASPEELRRFNVLGRPAEPAEIAGFIRFLATDASPYLTGAALFIDGGHTAALAMP